MNEMTHMTVMHKSHRKPTRGCSPFPPHCQSWGNPLNKHDTHPPGGKKQEGRAENEIELFAVITVFAFIFGLLLSVAIIEAVAVTVGLGYRMRKLKSKWSQSSKRLYSHFASTFSTMKIGETDPPWGTVDGN